MRIIIAFSVLLVVSCTAKKPWTKDAVVNECLANLNKKNETEKRFTGMQIPLLCDCMAEKLVAKYKSDDESSRDEEGVKRISIDCATEAMAK